MCTRQRTGLAPFDREVRSAGVHSMRGPQIARKADPQAEVQAMERELCTLLNTLAVSLLHKAGGSAEKEEARPVSKGKGKKRAADSGKL